MDLQDAYVVMACSFITAGTFHFHRERRAWYK